MLKQTLAVVKEVAPPSGVQVLASLSKGLNLLLKLREAKAPMSLSEISRALGMNKVTALRVLVTLEKFHFVEKDPVQKTYQIGSSAFYVGSGFISEGKQKRIFDVMRKLVSELRHTVTLSVLDGSSVLFVERVDGTERVKVTVNIGSRTPAYSSAAGKALLAGLRDGEIRKRLKNVRFERVLSKTRLRIEDVLEDIRRVRMSGYATNNEESTEGLLAIAVPVTSPSGEHVAALGAAFPVGILKSKEEQRLVAKRLLKAAEEIEKLDIVSPSQITSIAV